MAPACAFCPMAVVLSAPPWAKLPTAVEKLPVDANWPNAVAPWTLLAKAPSPTAVERVASFVEACEPQVKLKAVAPVSSQMNGAARPGDVSAPSASEEAPSRANCKLLPVRVVAANKCFISPSDRSGLLLGNGNTSTTEGYIAAE